MVDRIGLSLPEDLNERLEERLTYGEHKSTWIQDAMRLKFAIEEPLDDLYGREQEIERREFVEAAVKHAIEEEKDLPAARGHTARIDDLNPDREVPE